LKFVALAAVVCNNNHLIICNKTVSFSIHWGKYELSRYTAFVVSYHFYNVKFVCGPCVFFPNIFTNLLMFVSPWHEFKNSCYSVNSALAFMDIVFCIYGLDQSSAQDKPKNGDLSVSQNSFLELHFIHTCL